MKLSSRNVLRGKVKNVEHGHHFSYITVEMPGGIEIVSIVTEIAAQNLQLKRGKKLYVIIEAMDVRLGLD